MILPIVVLLRILIILGVIKKLITSFLKDVPKKKKMMMKNIKKKDLII